MVSEKSATNCSRIPLANESNHFFGIVESLNRNFASVNFTRFSVTTFQQHLSYANGFTPELTTVRVAYILWDYHQINSQG